MSDDDCVETPLVERRLVRLSTNQVVNSVETMLGAGVAATIRTVEDLPSPSERSFPPLAASGNVIGDVQFSFADRVADLAGKSVRDQFDACGDAPTDECGRAYVLEFAEKAFRRPLRDVEGENLLTVYDECKAQGASVPEAVRHGVWAVLDSPLFLYRTELGDGDANAEEVTLAPYELASELAYFLTERPPDDELLDAASRGELSTSEEVAAQAERLLATPSARENLESAMVSYFQLSAVPRVVLDPVSVPGIDVTAGLLNSLYHEGELFIRNTLWEEPLAGLLTSRRTWVNNQIAQPIYGVAPPVAIDADGFGPVELPENRAGLVTSAPVLATRARVYGPSVISRGLLIHSALLCMPTPPFPDDIDPTMEPPNQVDWTEREKAQYRAETDPCDSCHLHFDPFGLALDEFDALGRHRTMDLAGRPIDPSVVLPKPFEGVAVPNSAEMTRLVAESEEFRRCVAMNFMNFAFADVSQGSAMAPAPNSSAASCVVRDVVRDFDASGDSSFAGLVTAISRAPAFRTRRVVP